MRGLIISITQIVVLLFSVAMHEAAHGLAAFRMGDPTAKYQGRLTLNPLKHLDPVGSVLVPVLTYLTVGIVFGWAKPVPINPYNFTDRRRGEILVSLAGPVSNIVLGVLAAVALRFTPIESAAFVVFQYLSLINLFLAFFNLTPVPPLDGSHLLINLWPGDTEKVRLFFQRYGMILLFAFLFLGVNWFTPVVYNLFSLVSGLSL